PARRPSRRARQQGAAMEREKRLQRTRPRRRGRDRRPRSTRPRHHRALPRPSAEPQAYIERLLLTIMAGERGYGWAGMEHSPTSATGTAWERTLWHAAQRAA